jgi:predicted phosphodiesterase
MRIAIFSDVHGNLPSLDAVLADIRLQKPDAVYCLGAPLWAHLSTCCTSQTT